MALDVSPATPCTLDTLTLGMSLDPAQRLYMGQYMPVDSIARTFVDRNPKPRPEDMVNAYRKSDIPKMVGFRKLVCRIIRSSSPMLGIDVLDIL